MINKIYAKKFTSDCLKANQELSFYIKNNLKHNDLKSTNIIGYGGDIIKGIDKIAENIFVKYLLKYANIQSEESGFIKSNEANTNDKLIILDPLDGSDNLINNLYYYGTSIALKINNKTIISFVYNLVNNISYIKTPFFNNIKINKINTNMGIFERAYTKADIIKKLTSLNIKFRSPGATALSIANAHNYEYFLLAGKIREEDICAGLHICSDLNIYKNSNFLLVSKNIETFTHIKEIIKDI